MSTVPSPRPRSKSGFPYFDECKGKGSHLSSAFT